MLLAALQVVFSHGVTHLRVGFVGSEFLPTNFFPGVPIFFVVSGFLTSLSWERSPALGQYVRNRVLRIYPGLWACFVVSVAIMLASGVRPPSASAFVAWVVAQLTIVQFYSPPLLRGFGIGVLNGSLWTIPVELQFYVAVPLLYLLAHPHRGRWLALSVATVIVMLVSRSYFADRVSLLQKLLGVSLIPYLFYFLVGIVLRQFFERRPQLFRGRALLWALAYAAWVAIEVRFAIAGRSGNLLNVPSLLLLGALTISAAFTVPWLAGRLLRGNDISYGLYIYHAPLMNLLLVRHATGAPTLAALVALTTLAAVLSWRLVERPALALKNFSLRPQS